MRTEAYFCLKLTEFEHEVFESDLRAVCEMHGVELVYYRKLKDGHVPMYREIKMRGENVDVLLPWIEGNKTITVKNPHRA